MAPSLNQDGEKTVIEYVEQVDEKAYPQAGFIVVSHFATRSEVAGSS